MTANAVLLVNDPPEISPPGELLHGASVHFPDDAEPSPTVAPARAFIHFPDET